MSTQELVILEKEMCLFRKMQELGIEANSYTFSCVLKCFSALGSWKFVEIGFSQL
jgi:hypothetical protein